jgi:hypothetical protein
MRKAYGFHNFIAKAAFGSAECDDLGAEFMAKFRNRFQEWR